MFPGLSYRQWGIIVIAAVTLKEMSKIDLCQPKHNEAQQKICVYNIRNVSQQANIILIR